MTMATRRTRKTPRGKTRSLRGGVDERTLLYVTFARAFCRGRILREKTQTKWKGVVTHHWMTFDDDVNDDERLLKIPLKLL